MRGKRTHYDTPSYAVLWREEDGSVCSGELELGEEALRLDGTCRFRASCTHEVRYRRISRVRIGRAVRERIDGRAALVIELGREQKLLVTSTVGLGMIHEIAERLNALTGSLVAV